MGAVKVKDSVARTYKLRADLVRRMDAYRESSGVPNTFTLEKALERYLDEVAPKGGAKGGRRAREDR